jgi:beta-lactamase regulating signal transducer with metallopeptidase domain
MLSSSLPSLLADSAARSLAVAAVVGSGLFVLRARNVVAQKAAWMLVLAAAALMPWLAPWAARIPGLPKSATILLPRNTWFAHPRSNAVGPAEPVAAATHTSAPTTIHRVTTAAETQPRWESASEPESIPGSIPGSLGRFPAPSVSSGTLTSQSPTPARPTRQARPLQVIDGLLLLYLAGCAVLFVRIALGMASAIRLWRAAEPVCSDEIPESLRVRVSDVVASPVTVGSGIVLPADYADWDAEKLRIVLAHEASHVRQGDFWLQLCASLYTAAFWFSPLGWWIKRKLSDLSETISDGAAVGHAASHASYAQVLLEFAALPRPIPIGVAMANHGHVISRIERLLNESSFRQAFAGGRARIAAAVLLVPAALFAATALVRVEARAQASELQAPPPPPAKAPAAPRIAAPTVPAAVTAQPAPPALVGQDSAFPPTPALAPAAPDTPEIAPPAPDAESAVAMGSGKSWSEVSLQSETTPKGSHRSGSSFSSNGKGYAYSYQSNGDSYALISGNDKVTFSGDWYDGRKAELDKAKRMAHGDFLWFTRNGKSYILDDQQVAAKIKAMYAPMEALGKQQEELGRQQEELGKQQEALGDQQELASVPTPDMSKQIAAVEAAAASLKAAKGQQLTEEKLADMQEKLADLQAELGAMQGRIGEKQGELGSKQGALGAKQGELGAKQGALGAQQGRIAQEADKKVKSIIDESLQNGKARPVE